jgi:hypothetical protein
VILPVVLVDAWGVSTKRDNGARASGAHERARAYLPEPD